MTLSEMADFICGKVNQRETEDVAAAKGFLTRRHDMIWAEETWKDSLVEYRQTLDADVADYTVASNYLPTKAVLLLPPIFQRVLAARTSTRKLNIQRPEYFYRIDFDSFSKTGEPADYILLPPCVWEYNTSQTILAKRDAGDATTAIVADLLDSDGVGVTRVTKTLDEDYKVIGSSERIDALSGSVNAAVSVGAPGAATLENANPVLEDPLGFGFSAPLPSAPLSLEYTIAYGSSATVTPNNYVSPVAITGAPIVDSGTVPGGANFGGTMSYSNAGWTFSRATPSGVTLQAGVVNVPKRQRIRLVEIPTAEVAIRVLGKRYAPSFTADNDEPGISGMENCLIAFALGDMLERDESYTEASAKFEEAMELLKQLKKIEVAQQAHNCRVIPESGYGDDFFETPRGFNF